MSYIQMEWPTGRKGHYKDCEIWNGNFVQDYQYNTLLKAELLEMF